MRKLRQRNWLNWLPLTIILILSVYYAVIVLEWSTRATPHGTLVAAVAKDGAPAGTKSLNAWQNSSYQAIVSLLDELASEGLPMELQDHLSDEPPLQQCPQLANGTLGQLTQHYHTERLIDTTDFSSSNFSMRAALTMRAAADVRDSDVLPPPHMLHQSLLRYANAARLKKGLLDNAFLPFGQGCSGAKAVDAGQCGERDLATSSYCSLLPSHDQHILTTDCGLVENCYAPNASHCYEFGAGSYGTPYAASGIMYQNTHGIAKRTVNIRTNYQLHPDVEVQELDELAAPGTFIWPVNPGHFPNELLPALMLLDRLLPAHIPLLWPATSDAWGAPAALPTLYLQALQEENGLKPGRPIIELNYKKPVLYRAKRLYVFWSDPVKRATPISWLAQRLAAHHFNALARSRFERLHGQAAAHNVSARAMYRAIVLMRRPRSKRSLHNHAAVVTAMKNALGPEFEVDEYQPDGIWPAVERVNKACLLVGPHGANLNNMLFLNSNCKPAWVVEVGYLELRKDVTRMPACYVCLARNLGFKYYTTFGNGHFHTPITANTEEIFEIATAYKLHVAAMQRAQTSSHT